MSVLLPRSDPYIHRYTGTTMNSQLKPGLHSLWRATKGSRPILAVAAVLSVVAAAVSLVQPLIANQIIDGIQRDSSVTPVFLILMLVAVMTSGILSGWKNYLGESASEHTVLRMRRSGIARIIEAPIEVSGRWESGDMSSRVVTDVETVRNGVSRGVIDVGGAVVLGIGAAAALILIDLPSFLIVAASLVFVAVCGLIGAASMKNVTEKRQMSLGALTSVVERYFSKLLLVKTYNLSQVVIDRAETTSKAVRDHGLRLARTRSLLYPITSLSVEIAFIAVLLFGASRVATGELTIGQLAAFIMYVSMLLSPVGTLISSVASLSEALGAQERLLELDNEAQDHSESRETHATKRIADNRGKPQTVEALTPTSMIIELENVSYLYPGSSVPAIDSISVAIPRGTITAITGPSGAGKTTLVWLLNKLLEPSSGELRLNGVSSKLISPEDYRRQVVVVLQGSAHWGDSLWDSVTLGEEFTEGEVLGVFEKLGLMKFLQKLPDGFHSSNGAVLSASSAGELQRVSMARGLLRKPELLILDEPTSHLDRHNEELVSLAIEELRGNCTVIVVAHRDRSIVSASRVIKMVDGAIKEISETVRG